MRRSLAGTLMGSVIPLRLIGASLPGGHAFNFRSVELSWILEDNLPMRHILERLGTRIYKTYRVYGKMLGYLGSDSHIRLTQQASVWPTETPSALPSSAWVIARAR